MKLEISPQKTRVGWIGTGVMGRSMCWHISSTPAIKSRVFNRTKSKADDLVERGARWADSPRDVAAASDVVFAIVGYPEDVREVILGDDGALAGAKQGGRARRHDDQSAGAGRRDCRGGRGARRREHRCARFRRRRRREEWHALDHDRRRRRHRRRARTALES